MPFCAELSGGGLNMQPLQRRMSAWIKQYRELNDELLASDRGFAKWLERDYKPIAGGWQY